MWRRDMATNVLGSWLVAAVFVDGWAHFNRPQLESFFTPWHAALYSGLGAMALWVAALTWTRRRDGDPIWVAVPDGHKGAVIGVGAFALRGP